LVGKVKERGHLEDPGIDGNIASNWKIEELECQGGFTWLRTGAVG
jgi:hypothetical protein